MYVIGGTVSASDVMMIAPALMMPGIDLVALAFISHRSETFRITIRPGG